MSTEIHGCFEARAIFYFVNTLCSWMFSICFLKETTFLLHQGEDKKRFAWILSYIQHLLSLLARNGSMSNRKWKGRNENQISHGPATPQAVYRRLLFMFTEPGSSVMPTEKKELLTNYILVLTLFADDFRSNPSDICEDLKMTRQNLKPYYDQLGCKSVTEGAFKSTFMTLPAPLKFPKEVTRKRRRQQGFYLKETRRETDDYLSQKWLALFEWLAGLEILPIEGKK